jgi:uncharacterized protein YdeI (BOF family)
MKKLFAMAIAALFLAMAQITFADEAATTVPAGKATNFTVVDVACYISKGAYGPDHQACGNKCVKAGGELALKNGENLYIPVTSDYKSARKQFVKKCDTDVTVTGNVVSKGGVNYFVISDNAK